MVKMKKVATVLGIPVPRRYHCPRQQVTHAQDLLYGRLQLMELESYTVK